MRKGDLKRKPSGSVVRQALLDDAHRRKTTRNDNTAAERLLNSPEGEDLAAQLQDAWDNAEPFKGVV